MSQQELAALLAIFRAEAGPDMMLAPAEARQDFDRNAVRAPVPPELSFAAIELGGVSAVASTPRGAAADRVLFHFHGGAYVVGSAFATRALWGRLAVASGVRGVSVDYALAPERPYPHGIASAVAAYRGLLASGIAPEAIAMVGDSAGGGIVVGMLSAARQAGLPMPAAAVLLSPWVDLACEGASMATKAAEDPLITRAGLLHMAAHYCGAAPAAEASPLHADLRGLPPLLIQVGACEVLLDDAIRLTAKADAAGVAATLEVWPGMFHVWHGLAEQLGEAREAIVRVGGFIRSHLFV